MNYLLIGKPNVGKSSIFNILTGSRINIVHPEAGTTRDWHKELINKTSSYIFDTPGTLIDDSNISSFMNLSNIKLSNISAFLYVVNHSDGYNLIDEFSINKLRKFNKKIILIVNKFDNHKKKPDVNFEKYGIEKIFYISCSHNYGFQNLRIIFDDNNTKELLKNNDYSIAIFGKPNVGKSTFLNSILGYERSLTSPIANTTSDYVVEHLNYKNKYIKIIDTAGIGKKSNIKEKSITQFSIKKTFNNIKQVESSIIIIDAFENIDRQDKRIIKMISEKSKSIIIVFNKFDLIENQTEYKTNTIRDIEGSLSEIKNIKIFFISANKKSNSIKVLEYLNNFLFTNNFNISTAKLNKWLKVTTHNYQHPLVENKKINFKYAVQIKDKPVTIKIFCNYASRLRNDYKRYLTNKFNYQFKILNQKTKIVFSSSKNPYN